MTKGFDIFKQKAELRKVPVVKTVDDYGREGFDMYAPPPVYQSQNRLSDSIKKSAPVGLQTQKPPQPRVQPRETQPIQPVVQGRQRAPVPVPVPDSLRARIKKVLQQPIVVPPTLSPYQQQYLEPSRQGFSTTVQKVTPVTVPRQPAPQMRQNPLTAPQGGPTDMHPFRQKPQQVTPQTLGTKATVPAQPELQPEYIEAVKEAQRQAAVAQLPPEGQLAYRVITEMQQDRDNKLETMNPVVKGLRTVGRGIDAIRKGSLKAIGTDIIDGNSFERDLKKVAAMPDGPKKEEKINLLKIAYTDLLETPENMGEKLMQTVGSILPYAFIGGPVSQTVGLATKGALQHAVPKIAATAAGNIIPAVAGRAAVGGTIAGIREGVKFTVDPTGWDSDEAIKNIAIDSTRHAIYSLASQAIGAPVRAAIGQGLSDSVLAGKIAPNLSYLLASLGGGGATGASIAGVDMASAYMRDPEGFDMKTQLSDAGKTVLFWTGMELFYTLNALTGARAKAGWAKQVVPDSSAGSLHILGLKRGASIEEIKKAYRSLARSSHPDQNRDDPSAEARFKTYTAAYESLRKSYTHPKAGSPQQPTPPPRQATQQPPGPPGSLIAAPGAGAVAPPTVQAPVVPPPIDTAGTMAAIGGIQPQPPVQPAAQPPIVEQTPMMGQPPIVTHPPAAPVRPAPASAVPPQTNTQVPPPLQPPPVVHPSVPSVAVSPPVAPVQDDSASVVEPTKEPWQMTKSEYRDAIERTLMFDDDGTIPAREVLPPHEVRDVANKAAILSSMAEHGWRGRPVLVAEGPNGTQAITGSHRVAAAKELGLDVPVFRIDQDSLELFLEEKDMNLDEFIQDRDSIAQWLPEIDQQAASIFMAELKSEDAEYQHSALIQKAIAEGMPVPDAVLADYSELQGKPDGGVLTETGKQRVPVAGRGTSTDVVAQESARRETGTATTALFTRAEGDNIPHPQNGRTGGSVAPQATPAATDKVGAIEPRTGEVPLAEYEGAHIVKNYDVDRVQIFFDEKPGEEIRKDLNGAGWNFSRRNGAWQRKITQNAENSATQIVGKRFKGITDPKLKEQSAREIADLEANLATEKADEGGANIRKVQQELSKEVDAALGDVGLPAGMSVRVKKRIIDGEEAFMSLSAPWKPKKALAAPATTKAPIARTPKERLAERRQETATAEAQKQGEVTKQQIINAINKAFRLPIRLGKFHGKQRLAIYKTDKQLMRIRSQYARSLRHITHELGHHLDRLYKLADARFAIELTNVPYVQQLRKARPDTDEKTALKEGIAEFINMYLMAPGDAAKLTPAFLEHFEGRLLDHPDVQDKLLDLRQMIDVYTNQSDIEAHLDEFIGGEKPKHDKWSTANAHERTADWWSKFQSTKSKIYTAVVDRHNPVWEAAEAVTGDRNNPAFQRVWDTLRTSSSAGRAQQLIEEGQYVEIMDSKGKPTGDIEKVGPSLKEIWGTVAALGNSRAEGFEMISLFDKYIVSKHAIESEEQGIVSGALDADRGITIEHLEALVKKVEGGEYGNVFKKQLQEVLDYRNFIFDMLVAKDNFSPGHYSKADREVILGKWGYAIPFKRIFPETKTRGRGGGHASPVKRYKGADLPIVNPLESLMRETMLFNKLALENEAAVIFFKLSEHFPKEAGQLWDDSIPLPQTVTKTSLHSVIKQAIDKGLEPDFDIGTLENLSIELYRGVHVTQPGKHIAILWIGGKPKAFEVFDKELFGAITGLNAEQSILAGRIGSALAAPFRLGHLVNLAFPWRNIHRDTPIAAAHSDHGFIPYISFFDGIISSIAGPAHKAFAKFTGQYDADEQNFVGRFLQQQDEYKQTWLYYGGTMSSPDIFNDKAAEKMLENVMQKEAKKVITGWLNPLKPLSAIATASEMGTNIGETKRAYSKGVKGRRAIASGRDLTVDHNVYGSKMKLPRQVIPFLGSFIQGGAKMHRQIKNPRTRWSALMRYALYISLPTIINYLVVRDNPYYQEMGQLRKDAFLHIPIGNPKTTSSFLPIPRAHNLPGWVFGAMVERAVAYVDKHDPDAFKDWQESFKGNFTPPMTIWPLELSYELASNYNHFGGYPIENLSDLNRPKEERYGPYTTETAKAIGRAFGISPKKVDFSLRKVTGALGSPVVAGMDALLELANLTDGVPKAEKGIDRKTIIGDYFTTVGASGTNSMDRFYRDLEKATQLKTSERGPQNKVDQQYIDALPALRQVSSDLSDLRKVERAVHKATTWHDLAEFIDPTGRATAQITPAEKRKAIEYLQLEQINVVRVAYGKEPIPR